jgi:hypothetical protein
MPINHPLLSLQKGGDPPRRGGGETSDIRDGMTDSDRLRALRFPHDIGTHLNHHPWDLEATPPLLRCL